MHPKSLQLLEDIVDAGTQIREWTTNIAFEEYARNRLLRAGVERLFLIIGEALARLERTDEATAARIGGRRTIIGFRNRLAHGYDHIDDALVWQIVTVSLPVLVEEVSALRPPA